MPRHASRASENAQHARGVAVESRAGRFVIEGPSRSFDPASVGFVTDDAMRRNVSPGFGRRSPLSARLSGLLALACSAPSPSREPQDVEISAAAGSASAGMGGALSSAAGSAGATEGTFTSAGTATSTAGVAGKAGAATGGLSGAGMGGVPSGGVATGDGGGGTASGAGSGGGGGSASAACGAVKAEYATELEKQLACNPNAGSQCANKVAAAPGCECRVFMQPSDPFAIEHLSNVANGWFDADCSMPTCPAKCSTAATGTCQADSKSPLGGRCVSP
jgi:hypothetical protein